MTAAGSATSASAFQCTDGKAGGRAAIVIKNTFLSNTDNASVELRRELLASCNLHTVLAGNDLRRYREAVAASVATGVPEMIAQRVAGLLMKMGGAPIMWTWISILFFRWYRESERDSDEPDTAPPRPDALLRRPPPPRLRPPPHPRQHLRHR